MTSSKSRTPLYEALRRHRAAKPRSYHVPGHSQGRAYTGQDEAMDYAAILSLDVTELSDTDDLHQPEGVILEAQQLAAATFGSEESCFLVGGSTAGNLALILAHLRRGDILIVQRNVHKSVIHGLQLAQASAVFVDPHVDPATGLALTPSLAALREALQSYPQAKAVLLSNPSYYGLGVQLTPYVEVVHSYGLPLLVDEAHGAHFGLHPELPDSALQAGADAVVQSTHKTLTAMTMGAMLHMQGDRIDRAAIRQMLQLIQSSSPSYPIMASLDIARAMIDREGSTLFESALAAADQFRRRLPIETGFETADRIHHTAQDARIGAPDIYHDPLRVTIRDRTGRLSGYALKSSLEARGCWAEMADAMYVVLLFGVGTRDEDIEALLAALQQIGEEDAADQEFSEAAAATYVAEDSHALAPLAAGHSEPVAFDLHTARGRASETVELSNAEGRIAAEMIIPYPPGIPLVYAGERLSSAALEQLQQLALLGARCQGAADPSLRTIRVWTTKTV
ncbi:hypothetical protein PA598K_06991 [Paenibacillus sp. 598K]|uniref:aminotransferase class I/II-fold pyridoxal phosphate-dependent enzyme n=1 Tax=Paenibacillus sp. 598K TaxID=1117987 RepID=UPI000FFA9333|nr:aminotransferase class I/II-fold pyridoxal phosphate-dependent enzyme [Paenibacillus sp. 598K]GBF78360.1 hypothetical protein PA598K_06991 [Paenibacillus sp. 598K]